MKMISSVITLQIGECIQRTTIFQFDEIKPLSEDEWI